jgi:electron transport complex protein RnfD
MVYSLFPAGFILAVTFQFSSTRTTAVSLSAALLAEITARRLFSKNPTLYDGSSILIGLLFAVMIPQTLPSWMIALGSFSAVFVGKELFGGLGANPFHPSVVGSMLLHVCFSSGFLAFESGMDRIICPALFLGGLFLIWRKVIPWEIPFIYLGVFSLGAWIWGGFYSWNHFPFYHAFLAAFYLISDSPTTPLTRTGIRVFTLGCALLGVILGHRSSHEGEGIYSAVLLMNAVTPWIDGWMKPRTLRQGSHAKIFSR